MILNFTMIVFFGFFLGYFYRGIPSDLSLEAENEKLRKENQFLWRKLKEQREIED